MLPQNSQVSGMMLGLVPDWMMPMDRGTTLVTSRMLTQALCRFCRMAEVTKMGFLQRSGRELWPPLPCTLKANWPKPAIRWPGVTLILPVSSLA